MFDPELMSPGLQSPGEDNLARCDMWVNRDGFSIIYGRNQSAEVWHPVGRYVVGSESDSDSRSGEFKLECSAIFLCRHGIGDCVSKATLRPDSFLSYGFLVGC